MYVTYINERYLCIDEKNESASDKRKEMNAVTKKPKGQTVSGSLSSKAWYSLPCRLRALPAPSEPISNCLIHGPTHPTNTVLPNLLFLELNDFLLNRLVNHETHDTHRKSLTNPMHAVNSLFFFVMSATCITLSVPSLFTFHCRIPPYIHEDHAISSRKV